MADALILSPHYDDAVLSCWHVLTDARDVQVLNVFAGVPEAGTLAWWDRITGATDSAARMRERASEDVAALAVAGRTAANLGFLDVQYRDADQALEPVLAALDAYVRPGVLVYAPAALGDHVDHAVVRDAALALSERGVEVELYADLPHAVKYGWPSWAGGDGSGVVAARWARALPPAAGSPEIHELDAVARLTKRSAVAAYRSQLDALGRMASLDLPREVTWRLTPAQRPADPPVAAGRLPQS